MESAPWTPTKWEIRPAQVQYLLSHQQPKNLRVLKVPDLSEAVPGLNLTMTN